MTAISVEKIEVGASYGKVQLKRSDIFNINYPENGFTPPVDTTGVSKAEPTGPKVDESLQAIQARKNML